MTPQPPTNGQLANAPNQATSEKTDGSVVQQIIDQNEAKIKALPPQLQQGYKQIMAAGLKLLYSDQTHSMEQQAMQRIKGPQDVVGVVVQGIVKLIMTIYQESQRKMSIPMSIPAAIVLTCYVLGDIEKMKKIPITSQLAAQTIQGVTQQLYKTYRINPQQVQQAIDQGKAKQGQPAGGPPGPAGPPGPPTAASPTAPPSAPMGA